MKLQIALDAITLEKAVELVQEARDYVDILEIGTPMVIEYGMLAVRTMRENFPEKEILADLKIMDGGKYEANQAFNAGADYITVLGVTDNLTIKGCVEAANECGKEIVVDMICVDDLAGRVKELEALGAHGVAVHVGVDQQASGRTPLDDLKVMKAAASTAKVSLNEEKEARSIPISLTIFLNFNVKSLGFLGRSPKYLDGNNQLDLLAFLNKCNSASISLGK